MIEILLRDMNSDGNISEIDKQLYRKYKLEVSEIKFIKRHVKTMS